MDLEAIKERLEPKQIGLGMVITMPTLQEACWLVAEMERLQTELTEATRLQKKAEMLLESSERSRATLGEELQQVKGERDRYREALERIESAYTGVVIDRSAGEFKTIARAALHPATEEAK